MIADDVPDEDADDDEEEDVVAGLEAHGFLGTGCCGFSGGLCLLEFGGAFGGFGFFLKLEAPFKILGHVFAFGH
jgi:hypothetical protein